MLRVPSLWIWGPKSVLSSKNDSDMPLPRFTLPIGLWEMKDSLIVYEDHEQLFQVPHSETGSHERRYRTAGRQSWLCWPAICAVTTERLPSLSCLSPCSTHCVLYAYCMLLPYSILHSCIYISSSASEFFAACLLPCCSYLWHSDCSPPTGRSVEALKKS